MKPVGLSSVSPRDTTADLMEEATSLLKSLRTLKAVRIKQIMVTEEGDKNLFALPSVPWQGPLMWILTLASHVTKQPLRHLWKMPLPPRLQLLIQPIVLLVLLKLVDQLQGFPPSHHWATCSKNTFNTAMYWMIDRAMPWLPSQTIASVNQHVQRNDGLHLPH